jgi:hypothetical protein
VCQRSKPFILNALSDIIDGENDRYEDVLSDRREEIHWSADLRSELRGRIHDRPAQTKGLQKHMAGTPDDAAPSSIAAKRRWDSALRCPTFYLERPLKRTLSHTRDIPPASKYNDEHSGALLLT